MSASRQRYVFGSGVLPVDPPHLIAVQRDSYARFITEGLGEVFAETTPFADHAGVLECCIDGYTLGGWSPGEDMELIQPNFTLADCRAGDLTYAAALVADVALVNTDTGEIRRQPVFIGDLPLMTPQGSFVLGGTERVIVTQLVRSAGAYLTPPKDASKGIISGQIMPARGAWVEVEIDAKGVVWAKIDRKRRLPATTLLFALGYAEGDLPALFPDAHAEDEVNPYITRTLERTPADQRGGRGGERADLLAALAGTDPADRDQVEQLSRQMEALGGDQTQHALIEVFRRQRPGEPASVDAARALMRSLFFDPRRYDLGRVGRHQLDMRLGSHTALRSLASPRFTGVLSGADDDLLGLVRACVDAPRSVGAAPGDAPAEVVARLLRAEAYDEYEDLAHRRLRPVGEMLADVMRTGMVRAERLVRERLNQAEAEVITAREAMNVRPVAAAIREFFASHQLSQFMDQTNVLASLTHRRRTSALGAGGLTRERAPLEVRDVHPTHYGRLCPIESPEGPNIGLVGAIASYARLDEYGFLEAPYLEVERGRPTERVVWLTARAERDRLIAPAGTERTSSGRLARPVLVRRNGTPVLVEPTQVEFIDLAPAQPISVATALIPFLEHDDANRALMGANMQRQAVPLLQPEAPLVGTGMEAFIARDSGEVCYAPAAGTVTGVDAHRITITDRGGATHTTELISLARSNQGTLIRQRPVVRLGERVRAGDLIADASSTEAGELALGKNILVAFMSWEGYNFEDAIIVSERLVKDDVLTSVHIESHEIEARHTRLGDEEITRDLPHRGEHALRDLDERGIIRVGAQVRAGDILVGKITPKGEGELTAEERLVRSIFGASARDVRDSSLVVPGGEAGTVVGVQVFRREEGAQLSPGVSDLIRVHVATTRKIAAGDKLAGRHGNKGVIATIIPEWDMPFLPDGRPVDMILNPLGVPSRMNIGQILETHLGWAAHDGWQAGAGATHVATPAFDGATPVQIDAVLSEWERAHSNSPIRFARDPDAPPGWQVTGQMTLTDGRTGEPFEAPITVGYMYMLKLLHLVDDKIHARSTGPYSLVTQQPLGGKAQFGGQRLGEMEVWALEAYGAAYTLQEMLTIKSDDVVGRSRAYEAIVRGTEIPAPGTPESFGVLMRELQALGLEVDIDEDAPVRSSAPADASAAAAALGLDTTAPTPDAPLAPEAAADAEESV